MQRYNILAVYKRIILNYLDEILDHGITFLYNIH